MSKDAPERRAGGFTVVELVVTIAVAAIIVTVAIPSFADFLRGQRVTTQANDLIVSLTFARSEAIKRGLPVSVCASDNPGAASPGCSGSNDWDSGWIVFLDVDGPGPDGSVNPDGNGEDDRVLRIHEPLDGSQLDADGGSAWIAFAPDGLALARDDFTLRPDGCSGSQQRSIDVEATGRADVEREAC